MIKININNIDTNGGKRGKIDKNGVSGEKSIIVVKTPDIMHQNNVS
jgi:hypothetical protein